MPGPGSGSMYPQGRIRTLVADMASEPQGDASPGTYTIVAERIGDEAWHLTVRELPDTWTVAFARDDLERRGRERIALDLGVHPSDFDVRVVELLPPLH